MTFVAPFSLWTANLSDPAGWSFKNELKNSAFPSINPRPVHVGFMVDRVAP